MATITITNAAKPTPPTTFTNEVKALSDGCSQSFVDFNVNGTVTDYPMKIKINGAPSGAVVFLTKVGAGTGVFIDTATSIEFVGADQPKDGAFNLFTEVNLLLTNTGTTKFKLEVLASNVIKKMPSGILVTADCVEGETTTSVSTFASASLISATQTVTITNTRTLYY